TVSKDVPEGTIELLADSLDVERPPILSFIAVWTALEIFVNDIAQKKPSAANDLDDRGHEGWKYLSDRAKNEHKLTLVDRFMVTTLVLRLQDLSTLTEEFQELKSFRDRFVHRGKQETSDIPVDRTRQLLVRLLTSVA